MTKNRENRAYLVGAFHEMIELLEHVGFVIIGLIDKQSPDNIIFKDYPFVGNDEYLLKRGPLPGQTDVVISPDLPDARSKLLSLYIERGFKTPSIVGGQVSKSCIVGAGSIIQQQAFISCNCEIGIGVRVNVAAKVMHDCKIDDFTTIAPNAVLLGRVHVGKKVYIGANATILPDLKIGDSAIIGAGSVVTKNVERSAIVKGVPAK